MLNLELTVFGLAPLVRDLPVLCSMFSRNRMGNSKNTYTKSATVIKPDEAHFLPKSS
jgi:hypothetical protein